MIARIISAVLAFAVGGAVGFVLTFTHRQYVVGGVPWGLIGALAIVAALLVGMRFAFADRIAPVAAGAGVLGATALLATRSVGGSVLVADDVLGYVWAIGPAAITLVVALVRAPRPRAAYPATHDGIPG